MTYENLLVEVSERIATVTFNRPKSLNALNPAMVRELVALAPRRVELAARNGTATLLEPESEAVFWTSSSRR